MRRGGYKTGTGKATGGREEKGTREDERLKGVEEIGGTVLERDGRDGRVEREEGRNGGGMRGRGG